MSASQNGPAVVVDTLLQHGARVDLQKKVNSFTLIFARVCHGLLLNALAQALRLIVMHLSSHSYYMFLCVGVEPQTLKNNSVYYYQI